MSVKRFEMKSSGLRVSMEGFDLDVAAKDQLLFDSSASQLKIFMRGRLFMRPGDNRNGSVFAPYPNGRVFPKPPFAFLGFGHSQSTYAPTCDGGHNIPSPPTTANHLYSAFGKEWGYTQSNASTPNAAASNSNTLYRYQIKTETDRVTASWYFSNDGSSWNPASLRTPTDMTFYYAICDFY